MTEIFHMKKFRPQSASARRVDGRFISFVLVVISTMFTLLLGEVLVWLLGLVPDYLAARVSLDRVLELKNQAG